MWGTDMVINSDAEVPLVRVTFGPAGTTSQNLSTDFFANSRALFPVSGTFSIGKQVEDLHRGLCSCSCSGAVVQWKPGNGAGSDGVENGMHAGSPVIGPRVF